MRLTCSYVQQKTPRTLVIEALLSPFGGRWVGPPVPLTVAQIASLADLRRRQVRRVLRSRMFERVGDGYRIRDDTALRDARERLASTLLAVVRNEVARAGVLRCDLAVGDPTARTYSVPEPQAEPAEAAQ